MSRSELSGKIIGLGPKNRNPYSKAGYTGRRATGPDGLRVSLRVEHLI